MSPLLAPLLALTFGMLVHDSHLTALGIRNGIYSLLIVIAIGFLLGLVVAAVASLEMHDRNNIWPSDEMRNRGRGDGLIMGLAIALPSGISVALAVLGNNNASLIGVAISASLLPPAVNCGMSMAFALIVALSIHKPDGFHGSDFLQLAGLSLVLTLINICAIFLSALGMFRLKEVAPVVNKVAFWKQDVKLYRGLNKHQKRLDAKKLTDGERNLDALKSTAKHDATPGHRVIFSLTGPSFSGFTASTEDSSHIPLHDSDKWDYSNALECEGRTSCKQAEFTKTHQRDTGISVNISLTDENCP